MATKHASKSTKRGTAKKRTSRKIRTATKQRTSAATGSVGKTLKKSTAKKSAVNHVATYKLEKEGGPAKWFFPIMESAYSRLTPISEPEPKMAMKAGTAARIHFKSRLQPQKGEEVLAPVKQDQWLDILSQYKQRKSQSFQAIRARVTGMPAMPAGPMIPGQKNWAPLGPSVVTQGQAQGFPSVGGRVAGMAIDATGQTVYVASANGGVFRSRDAGMTWKSMMDAFDTDPQNFASTSLACGCIAIDKSDPNRVYVGTGEGNTFHMFQERIQNALPAYRGIGPIRSDDGGNNWILENTSAGSPPLAGKSFFAMAVDAANRENVVAGTSEGIYQRITTGGVTEWKMQKSGVHSSVVTSSSGGSFFFASEWGKGVWQSSDGKTWTAITKGFPQNNVGRIELAVQSNNPNVVYAMIADNNGGLNGIYRYDKGTKGWTKITNPPDVLPSDGAQGDYDLTITVDPLDVNLIYIGGSFYSDGEFWPASIWRCQVKKSGTKYSIASAPIGVKAHSDVHVLVHSPGDPNSLWAGTDGGVFLNRNPRASDNFASRNNGLACLCTNFLAQHPTDPNTLFCGLQDNGTARTGGGPIWKHVCWGDGGYCLINWASPNQVLVFANGTIYRATDGGLDHNSWSEKSFPWAMMTEPIVGPPYNPAKPDEAKTVALGSADKTTGRPKVYLSDDFGATWKTEIQISSQGGIYSMSFASATRFFVGTTQGEIFRVDKTASKWQASQINNVAAGPLALKGLISDIAVDWADATRSSIYICFGGSGDFRHVWHYDGIKWEARSGKKNQKNLLDVEHNCIVVDRQAPANIYVGADIGVWHSPDAGATWDPLPNGLPDAPVFDLQIHPTQRLLRASTHGRGLFEYSL
ncbi:MAG: hypothetical protein ACJ75B_02710 [Flavisolibacter sp.]